ncbi:Ribosome biogenesis protein erb1 [Blastocladiella emersonii ATCC 22665]|nr:Ribosome biogenesis protein erb1 [Blastocladiella emersonii ATCC 22665]
MPKLGKRRQRDDDAVTAAPAAAAAAPAPSRRGTAAGKPAAAAAAKGTIVDADLSDDDGSDDEFLDAEINAESDSDGDYEDNDDGAEDDEDDVVLGDDDREVSAEMLGRLAAHRQALIDEVKASNAAAGVSDEEEDDAEMSDDNGIPWGGSLSDDEDAAPKRLMRPEIVPETDSDDSDAEDHENTVGNVPMEWYNDYPHIGYDLEGKKILKPATSDELDKFLSKMDDPTFWTSIHDRVDQKDVELTEEELQIIHKLQSADYAAEGFNPYQDTVEWFTSQTMVTPLSGAPEPKRRFVPSKWEHKKVMKIVRAIRNGWIVPRKPQSEAPKFFDVWGADDALPNTHPMHLPAPKAKLPGNVESYNPPAEYLFTEEEKKEWLEADPEDRKLDFIPQKFDSLRKVPAYTRFIHDRFERCLDLYLCPRVRKTRVDVDPESLIPKLPDPKDLEPFPTSLSLVFRGHESRVRSFSLSPSGQFLLSGSDDGSLRLWEVATTRCLYKWKFADGITTVAWNPSKGLSVAAVATGSDVVLLNLALVAESITADKKVAQQTLTLLQGEAAPVAAKNTADGIPMAPKCEWQKPPKKLAAHGAMWVVHHQRDVVSVTWHRKGDYFASVAHNAGAGAVQIHQLSRKQTQQPFKKNKGLVITAQFHPTRPHLFIATQRYVRVYDLQQQTLLKKLMSGAKWISSMDIHPAGENVIIGSYDRRLCWWDLELGTMPYKTLRYHKQALRSVVFHPKFPLFASASDDGTIQVFHGMVYADLLTNPLIVPVKILRAHQPVDALGALNLQWHPTQPWIISSGADGSIKLWT